MLKTTTKSESGRKIELWLDGKTMKASVEGILENRSFCERKVKGLDAIDCGSVTFNGKTTNAVIKVDKVMRDFIDEAKSEIEKVKNDEILNGKIRLSYYFGDYYRVNSLFIDDELLDFSRAVKLFKNEEIKNLIQQEFISKESVSKKLNEIFKKHGEFILYGDLKVDETVKSLTNSEGISVATKEFSDLRGTGEYISEITFDNFESFEKFVAEALKDKFKQVKAKEEKIEAAKKEARETGKNVELYSYTDPCNDPNEECDVDHVVVYMTPLGQEKGVRHHTW